MKRLSAQKLNDYEAKNKQIEYRKFVSDFPQLLNVENLIIIDDIARFTGKESLVA